MIYLEAPNRLAENIKDWERTVFLGGSITGARNWQLEAKEKLLPYFNVFNPRRENYIWTESEERTQIQWEYYHIAYAKVLLFYFSYETLAPITLFEYGKALGDCKLKPWKKIYVCINSGYKRKNDLIIQTELENIEVSRRIRFDLDETCDMIITENK